MKYTLMPYQETASDAIMARLDDAAKVRDIGQQAVFALSAPTGTVRKRNLIYNTATESH